MLSALMVFLSAAPVSVAVPGVNCVGLSANFCESVLDRFVVVLTENGTIRAVAQKDIGQVLGLERQRQLLGCSDDKNSSCLAELAGALGVDGIVTLSLTRSDPYFVATARVLRTRDGSQWASASERVAQEGELFDAMDKIARKFGNAIAPTAAGMTPSGEVARSSKGIPWGRLTPGLVGLVALGAGTGISLWAGEERRQLLDGSLTTAEIRPAVESGRTKEQIGVGLMIGGGVAVATSVVWMLIGPSEGPAVSVVPGNDGATLVLSGRLP